MSSTENNPEDTNFLHFSQKLKFQEDSTDNIISAASRRLKLLLNYNHSIQNEDKNVACFLLDDDLSDYSSKVDDRNSLNNYAQYVKAISTSGAVHHSSDCSKWKSSLNVQKYRNVIANVPLLRRSNEDEKIIGKIFCDLKDKTKCNNSNISQDNHRLSNIRVSSNQQKEPSFEQVADKYSTNQAQFSLKPPKAFETNEKNYQKNAGPSGCRFITAKNELSNQNKKYGRADTYSNHTRGSSSIKRTLGGRPRNINNQFVPPIKGGKQDDCTTNNTYLDNLGEDFANPPAWLTNYENEQKPAKYQDERLKNLEPKLIELIENEIMDHGSPITWDDIAGLQFAKKTIQEIVVWPLLRPDIFTGLRRPPKGILLFGPPGTGKTLIGKCVASQSSSTFFSISASSLTSKWLGESEKLVRTLFAVARCHQPAVIFIDEIDSLLTQRSENEHESSRKVKTEFLVQLDGATTQEEDRILVIGATNRPQELDEAARRRLVKRLYIPLPELEARREIINRLMSTEKNDLTEDQVEEIAKLSEGYSGADVKNLCAEASLGPIRSIDISQMSSIETHQVRPVNLSDFISALKVVRSSVSTADLNQYLEWDRTFGSGK